MNVKEMIEWLGTLDPETKVVIEGLTYSSNVHKDTNEFYVHKDSVEFSTNFSDLEDGILHIGIDV